MGVMSNDGATEEDLVPDLLLCDLAILIFDIVLLLFTRVFWQTN